MTPLARNTQFRFVKAHCGGGWRVSWHRDEDGEEISADGGPRDPRWPASLAITAALLLYMTFPGKLTIGPGWLIPALEGVNDEVGVVPRPCHRSARRWFGW
jgi:hypothetical protein